MDQAADPELYARVARGLPGAWLEDPGWTTETRDALAGHLDRVTWDAPIHSVDDVLALDHPPKMLNIKPSRFGTVRKLFDAYDYCRQHGIAMYGGGQYELGPGRRQIQALASLFHPDAPNDVAPASYHVDRPVAGLPTSPLSPEPPGHGLTA